MAGYVVGLRMSPTEVKQLTVSELAAISAAHRRMTRKK